MVSEKEFQEKIAEIDPHTECYKSSNPLVDYISRKRLKLIYDLIEKAKGKKVIDVGCGDGFGLKNLESLDKKFYGIDISDKRVERARELIPKINIISASANDIPYQDNFFDITLCSEVLEHAMDPEGCIKELIRITKEGGTIIVTVPNEINWRIARLMLLRFPLKVVDHFNMFNAKKLDKLFGRKHKLFKNIPNLSKFLSLTYALVYTK